MANIICNTSPLQYLHQLELLEVLHEVCGVIVVPTAVVNELQVGRENGVDVPNPELFDWMEIQTPNSTAVLPLVSDLGKGETEVLALALELANSTVILDDKLARQVASSLKIPLTGTLGILIQAKSKGILTVVKPIIERLDNLGFRVSLRTKNAVLKIVGEL